MGTLMSWLMDYWWIFVLVGALTYLHHKSVQSTWHYMNTWTLNDGTKVLIENLSDEQVRYIVKRMLSVAEHDYYEKWLNEDPDPNYDALPPRPEPGHQQWPVFKAEYRRRFSRDQTP